MGSALWNLLTGAGSGGAFGLPQARNALSDMWQNPPQGPSLIRAARDFHDALFSPMGPATYGMRANDYSDDPNARSPVDPMIARSGALSQIAFTGRMPTRVPTDLERALMALARRRTPNPLNGMPSHLPSFGSSSAAPSVVPSIDQMLDGLTLRLAPQKFASTDGAEPQNYLATPFEIGRRINPDNWERMLAETQPSTNVEDLRFTPEALRNMKYKQHRLTEDIANSVPRKGLTGWDGGPQNYDAAMHVDPLDALLDDFTSRLK